jgi:hypothetical protein
MSDYHELYVSPVGDDQWTGHRAAVATKDTDGPLATIPAAICAARAWRGQHPDTPVRINLRGGSYYLDKPLELDHRDGGIEPQKIRGNCRVGAEKPLVIAAYKGEKPIISGGLEIGGFTKAKLHGKTVWVTDLPAVARGELYFRQLFVNDERRQRPRWSSKFSTISKLAPGPEADSWKTGYNDRFHFHKGDIDDWHNLNDVELVLLQVWIESRLWLQDVDLEQQLVTFDRFSTSGLSADPASGSAYFVENVYEALNKAGEWYLDRTTGRLTYVPKKGERLSNTRFIVPVLPKLLTVTGDAQAETSPEYIRFEGIRFSHTEWSYEAPLSGCEQAARMVPAAVQITDATRIGFHDCTFSHLGTWGVEVLGSSRDVTIADCSFEDLGAGGVKAWHGSQRTTVSDCEISACGRVFYSAVGVLIGNSGANKVIHNHIHDIRYTGISVGWHWGYELCHNQGNIIEYNHIHDIGAGYLSDMGGIYTLGPQQGTRLRFNHIHHVQSRTYGGWGIYPDEGSSDLLVESNLVHDCNRALFNQHYGRNNVVRNNIFAFGGDGQVSLSCIESHRSFSFSHNIVLFDSGVLFGPPNVGQVDSASLEWDHNLYFDRRGKKPRMAGLSWSAWITSGFDRNSIVADPRFKNAGKRRFVLKKNSPASKIGFQPFDVKLVGPRSVR